MCPRLHHADHTAAPPHFPNDLCSEPGILRIIRSFKSPDGSAHDSAGRVNAMLADQNPSLRRELGTSQARPETMKLRRKIRATNSSRCIVLRFQVVLRSRTQYCQVGLPLPSQVAFGAYRWSVVLASTRCYDFWLMSTFGSVNQLIEIKRL